MARCFSVFARSGSVLYRSERRNNSALSRLRLRSKSSVRASESFALAVHFDLAYRPVTGRTRLKIRRHPVFVLGFKVGELRQAKAAREVEGSRFWKLDDEKFEASERRQKVWRGEAFRGESTAWQNI